MLSILAAKCMDSLVKLQFSYSLIDSMVPEQIFLTRLQEKNIITTQKFKHGWLNHIIK